MQCEGQPKGEANELKQMAAKRRRWKMEDGCLVVPFGRIGADSCDEFEGCYVV